MSNENLDQDALATEEMLKMFEGVENDDTLELEHTEEDEELEALSMDEEIVDITDESLMLAEDDFSDHETMDLADTSESELLEVVNRNETPELTEDLDNPESLDETDGFSIDENTDENTDDNFVQSSDDEFPEADLSDISIISEADLLEADSLEADSLEADSLEADSLEADSLEADSLEEFSMDDSSEQRDEETISDVPATIAPSVHIANNSTNIADHLQAVVENAIQALQDWMQLRQEGQQKGPQKSLAQLDLLLDTVTHQQQQLAERLANNTEQQLSQISSVLGVRLATPQTLGWSDDDWRVKAQQVADKTDDISQRNAKIRQELARL